MAYGVFRRRSFRAPRPQSALGFLTKDPLAQTFRLTSGGQFAPAGADTFQTASVTPTANRLQLLAVVTGLLSTAEAVTTPSVSGCNLTWELVGTEQLWDNGAGSYWVHLNLYRALGSSPTTGQITFDMPGGLSDYQAWSLVEVAGIDTSGTNGSGAIVQVTSTHNATTSTNLSTTLNAFADSDNFTYGVFGYGVSDASVRNVLSGAGFTAIHERQQGFVGVHSQLKESNDTSVDATVNNTIFYAGLAVEIKLAEGISEEGDGTTISSFTLPILERPAVAKTFAGWRNKDNELAAALQHTSLPELGEDKHDYKGIQRYSTDTLASSLEYIQSKITFAVPQGPDYTDYSGFTAQPQSDASVEAASRITVDVPYKVDKQTYGGWQNPAVVEDANEYLEKQTALPILGRDRNQYGGWNDSVANRDETGALIEYRSASEFTALPPYARDRHSYDGWIDLSIVHDILEDPVAGFTLTALPPQGADTRDYTGYTFRTDLEQLRETPVGGFMFTTMPPPGPNSYTNIMDYTGRAVAPTSANEVFTPGKIWRPVFRPRRR